MAQKLSSRIRDLRVPEAAAGAPAGKSASTPAPMAPARPIVSPDLLDKLRKPVEPIESLPERQAIDPSEMRNSTSKPTVSAVHPAPAVSGEVMPSTTIQAAGTGTSRYWALVQQKINSRWVAPPVDLTQRYFLVVIRFTMDRSGKVVGIAVERSSGNDYYDNAGRRAVLSADPLPPFPPEIKEQQLSPLIYFSVGEPAG
jgi:TonB family protein